MTHDKDGRTHDGGVSRVGEGRFGIPGRIRTCAPTSGGRVMYYLSEASDLR